MKLSDLKLNDHNPRFIRDEKYTKLVNSLRDFPKMLALRPIVYDPQNMTIIGGNMRLRALKELGYTDIPAEWIKPASELTEEEKQRFIIEDNVGFGEWDWDLIANEWDVSELQSWGIDSPVAETTENEQGKFFSIKIELSCKEEKEDVKDVLRKAGYNVK